MKTKSIFIIRAAGCLLCGKVMLVATHARAQYNFIPIDDPSATEGTTPFGIDGNNIVGNYQNSSGIFGFLYNGSSYTTLTFPSSLDTIASGISGNNIVGYYNQNGFIYNISTASFTTLNNPAGANGITPGGISGNNIVGTYWYGGGAAARAAFCIISAPPAIRC